MLLRDKLGAPVITVHPDDNVQTAWLLHRKHQVRHLPVVEDGRLVGIVTSHDLRQVMSPRETGDGGLLMFVFQRGATVRDIMTPDPYVLSPDDHFQDAARLMHEHRIGGIPIASGDRLVGMVTETDILAMFIEIMGILEDNSRLEVLLPGGRDDMAEAMRVVREAGGEVVSIAVSGGAEEGRAVASVRLSSRNAAGVAEALGLNGYRVLEMQ